MATTGECRVLVLRVLSLVRRIHINRSEILDVWCTVSSLGQKCIVAKIGEKLQRDFTSSAFLRQNACDQDCQWPEFASFGVALAHFRICTFTNVNDCTVCVFANVNDFTECAVGNGAQRNSLNRRRHKKSKNRKKVCYSVTNWATKSTKCRMAEAV
jgi:hypothetical protein